MSGKQQQQGRLAGVVCVVTGGMRGFGASIVALFALEGARVVVMDLLVPAPGFFSAGPDPNTATLVASSTPGAVYAVKADVTRREDWQSALATTRDVFGAHPTVVVNNAGWTYSNKPTLTVTDDDFARVFDINVRSVFLSADVLLPPMLDAGHGGSFVNVSSTAALRPRPGLVWYNASKGAVSTATKGLAVEYAPQNVRFNTVSPVAGNTPLLSKFAGSVEAGDAIQGETLAKFTASIPIGRLSEGKDIANACLFLADPHSSFLTGIDVPVDGGRCI